MVLLENPPKIPGPTSSQRPCRSQVLGLPESWAPLGVRPSAEGRGTGGLVGPHRPRLNFRLGKSPSF